MSGLATCPNCGVRVWPMEDGKCPSCRKVTFPARIGGADAANAARACGQPDSASTPGEAGGAESEFAHLRDIDDICSRFEREWIAGGQPTIERFLEGAFDADRLALFDELLAVDLAYRRRRAEQPTADEYLSRFPEFASAIREAIANHGDLSDTASWTRQGEVVRKPEPPPGDPDLAYSVCVRGHEDGAGVRPRVWLAAEDRGQRGPERARSDGEVHAAGEAWSLERDRQASYGTPWKAATFRRETEDDWRRAQGERPTQRTLLAAEKERLRALCDELQQQCRLLAQERQAIEAARTEQVAELALRRDLARQEFEARERQLGQLLDAVQRQREALRCEQEEVASRYREQKAEWERRQAELAAQQALLTAEADRLQGFERERQLRCAEPELTDADQAGVSARPPSPSAAVSAGQPVDNNGRGHDHGSRGDDMGATHAPQTDAPGAGESTRPVAATQSEIDTAHYQVIERLAEIQFRDRWWRWLKNLLN